MTPEERAFLKLMADLATDGVFIGHRDAADQIIAAFEVAIEAERAIKKPRPGGRGLDWTTEEDWLR